MALIAAFMKALCLYLVGVNIHISTCAASKRRLLVHGQESLLWLDARICNRRGVIYRFTAVCFFPSTFKHNLFKCGPADSFLAHYRHVRGF